MKNSIELTEEQYKELIELITLGEFSKTKDILPKNYKEVINHPSTKLKNYILSYASNFNSSNLVHEEKELKGQVFLKSSDDLIEKYFDF